MVSADLRSLDRTALDHLRECAVLVVGVYPPGDETAELHLRQLGISTVLPADASGQVIQEVLDAMQGERGQRPNDVRGLDGSGSAGPGGPDDLTESPRDRAARAVAPAGTGAGDLDSPGVIIAVWGPAGAPGRTTIALNLASELAGLGQPTVLVDADTQRIMGAAILGMNGDEVVHSLLDIMAADRALSAGLEWMRAPVANDAPAILDGIADAVAELL